jgi:hypothetical protein
VSELRLGGEALGEKACPAEALALRYELGCLFAAISLGMLQALILSLRIADSLGQHLAQLSLGLRRFAREGFCPCCHKHYMGMPEAELKPAGTAGMSAMVRTTDLTRTWRDVRSVPGRDISLRNVGASTAPTSSALACHVGAHFAVGDEVVERPQRSLQVLEAFGEHC